MYTWCKEYWCIFGEWIKLQQRRVAYEYVHSVRHYFIFFIFIFVVKL